MASFTCPSVGGRKVTIIGAGVLGRRIASVWISGGYDVNIYDLSTEQFAAAEAFVRESLRDNNVSNQSEPGKLGLFDNFHGALQGAWLAIECVPERLDLKQSIFVQLEAIAPADSILVTNSSSYKSSELVANLNEDTKSRVCNMHYFMPPEIKLVELMTCGSSHESLMPFLAARLRDIGMHPLVARKESTGFVFNRLWAAVKREVLTMLAEGVTVPVEVDAAWTEMFTREPMGPCAMMDQVGLDTVSLIEQHYIKERNLPSKLPVEYLQPYIEAGRLGDKSEQGGLYNPASVDHDQQKLPTIFFLDIGLTQAKLSDVLVKGSILSLKPGSRKAQVLVKDQHTPDGIQISKTTGKIYWTSMGIPHRNDGSIWSSNINRSGARTIIPEGKIHTPKQMYIAQDKLFISDREGLRVWRANLDGSNLEIVVQTGDWKNPHEQSDQTRWCVGIAVSPSTGKLYWTQKGGSKGSAGRIFRANLAMPKGQTADDRDDVECLFRNLPEPIDIEVDEKNGLLYWTDRGELPLGNSVNRVAFSRLSAKSDADGTSLPGKDYDMIIRNLHEAIGLVLDDEHQHLYVTDLGGTVYRFDTDGGNKKKVYEGGGAYTGITLEAKS